MCNLHVYPYYIYSCMTCIFFFSMQFLSHPALCDLLSVEDQTVWCMNWKLVNQNVSSDINQVFICTHIFFNFSFSTIYWIQTFVCVNYWRPILYCNCEVQQTWNKCSCNLTDFLSFTLDIDLQSLGLSRCGGF